MDPFELDAIAPLLEHRERIGGQVKCVFRCPLTGTHANAGAEIPRPRLISRLLRRLLRRPPDVVRERDLRRATVGAFRRVSEHFHWDEVAGCWVGKVPSGTAGPSARFLRQLQAAPVKKHSDRQVLQRMLVEVALADREVSALESAFLTRLLEREVAIRPVTDLHPGQPLSPAELEAVTPGPARETMLMLAHAVALCDGPSGPEVQRLEQLARALGIDEPRVAELHEAAQGILFEKHLDQLQDQLADPDLVHARALDAAQELRLDPQAAARWEALYRQLHA